MSKIDLDPITSGYNLSKINANFQKVEDELNNKVLYRNPPAGEPNSMSSNLDMNSRSILNANKISSNILELGGVQVVPSNLATDPYNGTREALRRSYAEAGYNLVDGSFEAGGTLVNANDVLLHEASGKAFSGPAGVVDAGTDPTLPSSGYVPRADAVLRNELAEVGGVSLVGNAADSRGQVFTGRVSAPNLQVGDVVLTGDALRDGAVVSRTNSGATNIHGFADRTRLTAVSDYGGYGAFDSTVAVASPSAMNHTFSFQHRVAYDGTGGGTIDKIAGLLSSPTIYAGTVEEHTAVRIGNPDIKPGAVLNQNVGIDIGSLFGAVANVGLKMSVDIPLGYNIYQPGYSKNYLAGAVGINDTDVEYKGEPLRLKGYGAGAQPMSFNTTATEAHIGFAAADSFMKFYTGGELGFQLAPTTTYERAFTPGSDNQQPLGTMPYRWKVVIAGTGAIVTSDERTKAEIRSLSDAEISAGVEIGKARKLYKLRQSIEEKGSDDARWHCGWIAQDVKAIMERHGLDPFQYGFFCHDEWPDQLDDSGNVILVAGERYSLRYDELICFVDAAKETM